MKQTNTQPPNDELLLLWEAPTHLLQSRGWLWYTVFGILMLLCLVFSIFTKSWSFTAVLILGLGFYALSHRSQPGNQSIALYKNGFYFKNQFTRWEECEAFWMLHCSEYTELHIEKKKSFLKHITIQTGNQNPTIVRSVMQTLVPEHIHEEERILDMIIRICKL